MEIIPAFFDMAKNSEHKDVEVKRQKYISHTSLMKRNKNFDILPQYLKDRLNAQSKFNS